MRKENQLLIKFQCQPTHPQVFTHVQKMKPFSHEEYQVFEEFDLSLTLFFYKVYHFPKRQNSHLVLTLNVSWLIGSPYFFHCFVFVMMACFH